MSTDVVLLALRVITGGLLLAFLIGVFVVLWRDYRATASAVEAGHRAHGRLLVVRSGEDGPVTGTSYPLLPLTSLGRAPTNAVILQEPYCSLEHALVTQRGGQWWLEDRDSRNGTLLNGEPVREPVVISSGDVIEIGQVQLKIELQ